MLTFRTDDTIDETEETYEGSEEECPNALYDDDDDYEREWCD